MIKIGDLKNFDPEVSPKFDLLMAGFPCPSFQL